MNLTSDPWDLLQTSPIGAGSRVGLEVGLEVMPIDSVTLSDGHGPRERTPTRRSVLERSVRSDPLEARRTAFSVAWASLSSDECAARFGNPEVSSGSPHVGQRSAEPLADLSGPGRWPRLLGTACSGRGELGWRHARRLGSGRRRQAHRGGCRETIKIARAWMNGRSRRSPDAPFPVRPVRLGQRQSELSSANDLPLRGFLRTSGVRFWQRRARIDLRQ
jgi:hypothetical protein